ncbi:MAG: SEL1-like repeat protein [Hyphomicrobiales bacterium]|nr:SEL1-like repeat protein [Hyphomicrobiales bacterium]
MAWDTANAARTRQIAANAARRAGMTLEEWLDEAIVVHAARKGAEDPGGEKRGVRAPDTGEARTSWLAGEEPTSAAQDLLEAAVSRIERGLVRNTEQTLRALESLKRGAEQSGPKVKPPLPGEPEFERAGLSANEIGPERKARAAEPPSAMPRAERRQHEAYPPAARAADLLEPSRKPIPASSRLDLHAAVSEIGKRRQELEGAAAGGLARGREPAQAVGHGDCASPPLRGDSAAREGRSDEPSWRRSLERDMLFSLKAPNGGVRALVRKLNHFAQANADLTASAAGVATICAEIAEIRRSLADVAPRNAIVALEGAVRDLTQRVEILRLNGHREALLAPLDAMAAELRATLKAHDPQTAAANLEREVGAIGAKIESLAESAIKPEMLEKIQVQTEEVRRVLAAAAMRADSAEHLESRIAELADRVEQLCASAAPQVEIQQLAAALADLRNDIELRMPLPALASIERRLERIAQRLDEELARPHPAAVNERPFEDLARRIDGVREVVKARLEPTPEAEQLAASVKALNAKLDSPFPSPLAELMRELSAKLEAADRSDATPLLDRRLADIADQLARMPEELRASAVDVQPLVEALHALEAKLAAPPPPLDRDAAQRIADAVARRVEDLVPGWTTADVQGLVEQLAAIHDRLDAIAGPSMRSDALEPLVRELLVRLHETQPEPGEPGQPVELASVAAELSNMRLERAKADQDTQARFEGLEGVLGRLVERLALLGSEPQPPSRENAAFQARGRGGVAAQGARAPEPHAAAPGQRKPMGEIGEEFLLEPGQGAPGRVQEAQDPRVRGSTTTHALTTHIAAARRASQAAAELGAMDKTASADPADPTPVMPLLAGQRRYALLALALAALVGAAVRFGGHELIAFHKPPQDTGAAKPSEKSAAPLPSGSAFDALGARTDVRSVDVTPTASIEPKSEPAKSKATAGASIPDLPPVVPAGAPQALRDAATAGVPSAEYELGQRLYDGRGGLSQDQRAAALWFERAARTGFAPAQFRIAALYQKGVGLARDDAAAKRWYSKAAEAGHARAQHNLAVMDAEPADGPPDYVEAAKWFRKAAELGVRDSQFNLAVLYARGLGVERDLKQAWMWFSLAAGQGDADAAKKRDEVAAKMDAASLATAIDELSKFRAGKPDPAANQVESPPGGWDAPPG